MEDDCEDDVSFLGVVNDSKLAIDTSEPKSSSTVHSDMSPTPRGISPHVIAQQTVTEIKDAPPPGGNAAANSIEPKQRTVATSSESAPQVQSPVVSSKSSVPITPVEPVATTVNEEIDEPKKEVSPAKKKIVRPESAKIDESTKEAQSAKKRIVRPEPAEIEEPKKEAQSAKSKVVRPESATKTEPMREVKAVPRVVKPSSAAPTPSGDYFAEPNSKPPSASPAPPRAGSGGRSRPQSSELVKTPTQSKFQTPPKSLARRNTNSPASTTPSTTGTNDKPIKVAIRVRPFSDFEKDQGARRTISKIGQDIVVVNPNAFDADPDAIAAAAIAVDNNQWAQHFSFDHCLWLYDSSRKAERYFDQVGVHEVLGLDIVENALNGVNCSCFAYGHTTTGKTYSLFGYPTETKSRRNSSTPGSGGKKKIDYSEMLSLSPESGLVPRVFHDLVKAVKENLVSIQESRIFFSYLEVYNENVIDLLADRPNYYSYESVESLKIREHPVYGPYVENLTRVEVFCVEDVFQLIADGHKNRATAQTEWNAESSRSHAIATLELTSMDINELLKVDPQRVVLVDKSASSIQSAIAQSMSNTKFRIQGDQLRHNSPISVIKVQMVDLAGSEKDSKEDDDGSTWQGSYDATPKRNDPSVDREKKELKMIRRSLATLGYIIQSLSRGASFKNLPYRDSVLTFLLRDALSGDNFTTMLATISPAHIHYEETLSTLRYAEKLRAIRKKKAAPLGMYISEMNIQDSRPQLIEDFRQYHSELGGQRGSLAARQILQATISDPQQRIAKLTRGNSEQNLHQYRGSPQQQQMQQQQQAASDLTFTSPIDGSVMKLREITADDLEHLQSSYRDLQGQVVELQIDLDAIRTDRDTLMVELRGARDHINDIEDQKNDLKQKNQNLTKSSKAVEKEIAELRAIMRRKEDEFERLMNEVSEQKLARASAEAAYQSRTKEFLSRFDSIKK